MTEETKDPKALVAELMAAKKANAAEIKTANAAVREAKKNVKAAEAYRKALADDAPEIADADEALAGWQEALVAREQTVADAKATQEATEAELAAAREAAKAKSATPKVERVEQNGIKHPIGEGPSSTVWAEADKVTAQKGEPAALAEILDACVAAGVKESTTRAAYAHWRKFHGITGRVESAEAKAKKEAEAKAKAEAAAAAAAAAAEPAPAD